MSHIVQLVYPQLNYFLVGGLYLGPEVNAPELKRCKSGVGLRKKKYEYCRIFFPYSDRSDKCRSLSNNSWCCFVSFRTVMGFLRGGTKRNRKNRAIIYLLRKIQKFSMWLNDIPIELMRYMNLSVFGPFLTIGLGPARVRLWEIVGWWCKVQLFLKLSVNTFAIWLAQRSNNWLFPN